MLVDQVVGRKQLVGMDNVLRIVNRKGGKSDVILTLKLLDLTDYVVQVLRLRRRAFLAVDDGVDVRIKLARFLDRMNRIRIIRIHADEQVIHGFRIIRRVYEVRYHVSYHICLMPRGNRHRKHLGRRVSKSIKIQFLVLVLLPEESDNDRQKKPDGIINSAKQV